MEDIKIIELFFARSEEGLAEVERKYGALCGRIAYGILCTGRTRRSASAAPT